MGGGSGREYLYVWAYDGGRWSRAGYTLMVNAGSTTQSYNLSALTGSRTITGTVNYNTNRIDRWNFTITGRRRVTFQLTGLRSDADIYLYTSSGRALAYSARVGTATDTITYTLTAGTYYIDVRRYTNSSVPNTYRLAISNVNAAADLRRPSSRDMWVNSLAADAFVAGGDSLMSSTGRAGQGERGRRRMSFALAQFAA